MRFEIRRKEYDFGAAPDLTGRDDAAYVPMLIASTDIRGAGRTIREGGRFGRARDAAIEAARMCHEAIRAGIVHERCAFVRCDYIGERPSGAMKYYAYVSYRARD